MLRQLRHPQAPGSEEMAGGASPLSRALHTHQAHPGSTSWIERWFAEMTGERESVAVPFEACRELIKAINDYVRIYNQNPRPFQWVASASRIIRKVNKYKETSDTAD